MQALKLTPILISINMKNLNRIDVHHHIFPKEYVNELKNVGLENSMGVDFPKWTPESSLKLMDKNNIQKAILSLSAPGVYYSGVEFKSRFSEKLARLANEAIAESIKKYPDRFGGFATIPLLNVDAAMEELSYSLDKLKFQGICLMTNYLGKYLGNEDFEEFFAELNRRNALVFIHPIDPAEQFDPKLGIPNSLIEAPFDTTRAIANMMYNGVFDRYPKIKYILSHGGGVIPYLAWRLSLIEYGQKGKKTPIIRSLYDFLIKGEPAKGLKHLKRMYFDTALVSGKSTIQNLQNFAGSDNILFGSDLPIAKVAPIVIKNFKKLGDFNAENLAKIERGNFEKLILEKELKHYSFFLASIF